MALRKPFFSRDSLQRFSGGIFKSLLTVLFFLNWSLRKNPPPRVREQASWPPLHAVWRAHVQTTDARRGGPISMGRAVLSCTQQGPCRGGPARHGGSPRRWWKLGAPPGRLWSPRQLPLPRSSGAAATPARLPRAAHFCSSVSL